LRERIAVKSINFHQNHDSCPGKLLGENLEYQVIDLKQGEELKPSGENVGAYVIKHAELIPFDFNVRKFVNSLEKLGCKEVIFISRLGKHEKILILNILKKLERDVEVIKVFKNGRIQKNSLKFYPYVYVYTGFRNREGIPSFILAFLEAAFPRRIFIEKERAEDLSYVSELIKKHYMNNSGELKHWGKIKFYVYHNGFGEIFTFDVDGNLLKEGAEFVENSYGLLIKGRTVL